MENNSKRVEYFDFLRGIAIFMVIGIHTFGLTSLDGGLGELKVLFRQVIGCAVPLFLAISGYFLAKKKKKDNYLSFLKNQIPKVYIPVLIWSLPYLISGLFKGYNPISVFGLYFLCGFSIYYFVALIMQYYILLPVLAKFNKLGGVIVSCLITAIAVSVASYCVNVKGWPLHLVVYAGPFPVWMAFFVVGLWLGNRQSNDYNLLMFVLLSVVSLPLCFVETKYLQGFNGRGLGLKLSSHIYSFAAIMVLFHDTVRQILTKDNVMFRFFSKVGNVSFGIYLTHMFLIELMARYNVFLGWLPAILLVLLLSAVIVFLFRKILPYGITGYLGLR